MEETKMHITKWKKPIWKGYILYDCMYVCVYNILENYENYENSKKINGCQGLERGNDE